LAAAVLRSRNLSAAKKWCDWYNSRCAVEKEKTIKGEELVEIAEFFAESDVTVGNRVQLELAALEKEEQSAASPSKVASNLLGIVNKRKAPIMEKSVIIMNILPITVPPIFYICNSAASSKREIYSSLSGKLIPPFIWRRDKRMMSFVEFNERNPLSEFIKGIPESKHTKELQIENPPLSSHLVNIHLRRILWNRGIYRDKFVFYFPMLDKSKEKRTEIDCNGRDRWVTWKIVHRSDTRFAKKGETNFFFHRAAELGTPTYWAGSYIELIPRRYYTLDGETPIEGEIRAKIDAKFRNPYYDRSRSRIGLMRFWKFLMFDSESYAIQPENWFARFKFGEFLTTRVGWSPKVIGRDQTRLWDFGGKM